MKQKIYMPEASADMRNIYSVSEITQEIKELLELSLPTVWVQGELSNFVHHSSGHMYFSLKDKNAQIACVMWSSRNLHLPFTPQNGMLVNVYGAVRVYEKRGNYQLDIARMMPAGIGELQRLFEALKEKLYAEGLFDQDHKRPLPRFPEHIGIVTSPTGAAIQDILNVLNRRFPSAQKILRPTLVQGDGAAADIAAAIGEFNDYGNVDVLIVGRGGGSLEDLWAFNEEIVARAIYASRIPVVSAVGHEIDYTISDFVADLRAPTPSAAAEMVAPDQAEVRSSINALASRCAGAVSYQLESLRELIAQLQKGYAFRRPLDQMLQYKQRLDDLSRAMQKDTVLLFQRKKEALNFIAVRIKTAHPQTILSRGYAIVKSSKSGVIIKDAAQLSPKEKVTVHLASGAFDSQVTEIRSDVQLTDS